MGKIEGKELILELKDLIEKLCDDYGRKSYYGTCTDNKVP